MLTEAQLRAMARGKPNADNLKSLLVAIKDYGFLFGLDAPHRLAHFLAQALHESGSFKYDKEIWGPTPAQKRYDTRTDLGNTKARDGDGKLYMGRSAMQITGKANYAAFTAWARKFAKDAPDFVKNPEEINTDPWEGLGPVWYWDNGNPERKSLNRYADDNNIEMVTRRINGGLNGYADRLDYYVRAALVLLGYKPDDVKGFQAKHKAAGSVDGVAGEKTRMALHAALRGSNPYEKEVTVEVEVEKPVVPEKVDEKVKEKTGFWQWLVGIIGGGGAGVSALSGSEWTTVLAIGGIALAVFLVVILLRRQIIAAVGDIRSAVEG